MLSAAENVGVPLRLARAAPRERERRVELLLELVGLADHAGQRPGELSGGQQQRVAIARALAASPRLLIADEPTGQLDAETGLSVMALLRGVVESEGVTALVSTHDPVMMALADRVVRIATDGDGLGPVTVPEHAVLRLWRRRARAQWPLLAALLAVSCSAPPCWAPARCWSPAPPSGRWRSPRPAPPPTTSTVTAYTVAVRGRGRAVGRRRHPQRC